MTRRSLTRLTVFRPTVVRGHRRIPPTPPRDWDQRNVKYNVLINLDLGHRNSCHCPKKCSSLGNKGSGKLIICEFVLCWKLLYIGMDANMEGWTYREMEGGEDQWWMWGWIDGRRKWDGKCKACANDRIRLFSIKRHNCLIDSKLFEIATGHWRSVSVPSRGCSYSQHIRVLLHFNCSLIIV